MTEQIPITFDNDPIGASILEAITSGLYSDNLNCVREYVQNAIDARAKNIRISYCNGGKDIEILDDGHGMDLSQLTDSLRVGYSEKKGEDIGWRGIGIWSGAAVCERIQIATQTDVGDKLVMSIKCAPLTDTNRPPGDRSSAAEILRESLSEVRKEENDGNGGFTKITLMGIYGSLMEMFSPIKLSKFLERTVPMKYSEKFIPGKKIVEYLTQNGVREPEAAIYVDKKELKKNPVESSTILPEPQFVEITHKGNKLAVAWFVGTNRNKRLKGGEITFRKSNFRVGETSLVYKSTSRNYRGWQHGEIHILNDRIIENASRDGFNASVAETNQLYEEIEKILSDLELLSQYTSVKMHAKALEKVATSSTEKEKISIAKEELRSIKKPTYIVPDYLSGLREQVDSKSDEQVSSLRNIITAVEPAYVPPPPQGGGPLPSRAFETLKWDGLDPTDNDENALIYILNELQSISKKKQDSQKLYRQYPMATGLLIRSAYERSLRLLAKANKITKEVPFNLSDLEGKVVKWVESGRIKIDGSYGNSDLYRSLCSVKNNGQRELLNDLTHNTNIVRLTGDSVETLASEGMCTFLQSAVEAILFAKGSAGKGKKDP